jgi:hypothetical protein
MCWLQLQLLTVHSGRMLSDDQAELDASVHVLAMPQPETPYQLQ